jgi:hypothetical protein
MGRRRICYWFARICYWFARIYYWFARIYYWFARIYYWFARIYYWFARIYYWFARIYYWFARICRDVKNRTADPAKCSLQARKRSYRHQEMTLSRFVNGCVVI